MHQGNLLSPIIFSQVEANLKQQVADSLAQQTEFLNENPDLQTEDREDALLESLRAQRAALAIMLSNGVVSDSVYEELVTKVDASLAATHHAAKDENA